MSRPKGFKHTEETKTIMRASHPHLHRPHTIEEKQRVSEKMKEWHRTHVNPRKGKKASVETREKMSLARQGSKNANWKGGLTELIKGIRRSPEFYQWRKAILERDNHTCQDCGSTEKVDTHHLKSLIDHPELVFDINNGLTLCEECHTRHTAWQRLNRGRKRKSKKQK